MALRQLDHVSILAPDPEPVVRFYTELLGFETVRRREMPDLGMNVIDLARSGDAIEVIQPLAARQPKGGIKHIAFRSDDIEADLAAFEKAGAELLHREVQRHDDAAFFFVKSPSGEWVEIIQYAAEPGAEHDG